MAKQKQEQWYNSRFYSKVGEGLGIAFICLGIGYGVKGCNESHDAVRIEEIRAKARIPKHFANLNENIIPDEFYVINGEIAITKLDGKRVVKSLLNQSLDGVLERE